MDLQQFNWATDKIIQSYMTPQMYFFTITEKDIPAIQVLSFTYSVGRGRGGKDTKRPGRKVKRSAEVYLPLKNTKIVYREERAGDVRHLPLERGIKLQKQGLKS